MDDDLQKRVRQAMADPSNMGEMPDADAVGTVGNSDCGEMMRLWLKFKEQAGRKVIDQATFQSFGCETAIAVASMATEMIRGKTAEEALAIKSHELAGELGPLPPMKIHCAELVENALRSALESSGSETADPRSTPSADPGAAEPPAKTLMDSLHQAGDGLGGRKTIKFLDNQ